MIHRQTEELFRRIKIESLRFENELAKRSPLHLGNFLFIQALGEKLTSYHAVTHAVVNSASAT